MSRLRLVQFICVLGVLGFLAQGCENTDPSVAKITCKDVSGAAVSGATVVLYCQSSDSTQTCVLWLPENETTDTLSGTTNSMGQISQDLGLPAVLRIRATKNLAPDTNGVDSNLVGEGFIKLEEHAEVEQTITMVKVPG